MCKTLQKPGTDGCAHHTEMFDPAERAIYCVSCGEFTAYTEERTVPQHPEIVWIYIDEVVTNVDIETGQPVEQ